MYYIYHIHRKNDTCTTKGYIGVTTDYKSRWRHHKHHLKANTHTNQHLQNAWNKYDNIIFTLLHTCNNENDMLQLEVDYRPQPNIGWNCKSGGTHYSSHSESTKNKIRNYNLGRKHSKETRYKQSIAKQGITSNRLGCTLSDATKEKLRQANLGKITPKAICNKISASNAKFTEPKFWIHISGLIFYGAPYELRITFPSHKLATSALVNVYNEKYNKHKGWYLYE